MYRASKKDETIYCISFNACSLMFPLFLPFSVSYSVLMPADPGPLALEGCDKLKRANVFLACFLESLRDALCKGLSSNNTSLVVCCRLWGNLLNCLFRWQGCNRAGMCGGGKCREREGERGPPHALSCSCPASHAKNISKLQ